MIYLVHNSFKNSSEMWNKVMHSMLFKFIDHILEIYISYTRVNHLPIETPKFRNESKISFDDHSM